MSESARREPVEAPLVTLLGYLNFSEGEAPPSVYQAMNEAFKSRREVERPWSRLLEDLSAGLSTLSQSSPAFRDPSRAQEGLRFISTRVLPGYRTFHRDLLAHRPDGEIFHPYFLAKVFQAVVSKRNQFVSPPEDEGAAQRWVDQVIEQLNDFVGYRPAAILENGRQCLPYSHERVGVIPLYRQGAGLADGPYEPLLREALLRIDETDPGLLRELGYDPARIVEISLDPRAYDHGHPVNQRAGHYFGEWDPETLDREGRYTRFVIRPMIVDAILEWTRSEERNSTEDVLFRASTALAGTMLLAAGMGGEGPHAHDSGITLGVLVPKIAQARDRFYQDLFRKAEGPRRERLEEEANATRQPLGSVRQFLNRLLAQHRASQLHNDRLARIFARMGMVDAALRRAEVIAVPSVRLASHVAGDIALVHRRLDQGLSLDQVSATLELGDDAIDRLHRGIECGALVDPWNILGFQGNFPLWAAAENSVFDTRVPTLVGLVEDVLDVDGRLLRELAALGAKEARARVEARMKRLASWWDRFATTAVSGIPAVDGSSKVRSARFVADVLGDWRGTKDSGGDPRFWRERQSNFNSPEAYGSVIDALIDHGDLASSMALLMKWIGSEQDIPLESGAHAAEQVAIRWLGAAMEIENIEERRGWIERFLDHFEVNSEERRRLPALTDDDEPRDDTFAAAYEGVTYEDSAEDGAQGETAEGESGRVRDDVLSLLAPAAERALTLIELGAQLARRAVSTPVNDAPRSWAERLEAIDQQLHHQASTLDEWMNRLADTPIPPPIGTDESMIEFQRQQEVKLQITRQAIGARLQLAHAGRAVRGAGAALTGRPTRSRSLLAPWEPLAVAVEQSLRSGQLDDIRNRLSKLLEGLSGVALLYTPLEQGGKVTPLCQARYTREFLRQLARDLPRLGLFNETFSLLDAALDAEMKGESARPQVSEFNLLFSTSMTAVVENLLDAMDQWPQTRDRPDRATIFVEGMIGRFASLWLRHLDMVRLSEIERVSEREWKALQDFIRRFGHDLFTQRFMALGNLKGIVQEGAKSFLERWANDEGNAGAALAQALTARPKALDQHAQHLELILRILIEQYGAYRDYNTTTTQSDYGENLFSLLDLLRVRADYDRRRAALTPAYIAHGVIARRGWRSTARRISRAFAEQTQQVADEFVERLRAVEKRHALRLSTIADRIEERLSRPLELDQLLALVGPAARATSEDGDHGAPLDEKSLRADRLFEREAVAFLEKTEGAGVDVPDWLNELEGEVDRILEDDIGQESASAIPQRFPTFEDFQKMVEEWGDPNR